MNDLLPIAINGKETPHPLIISGPCSAESEEQVLATAMPLAAAGIPVLRAGIWKPRTKPGGFEGVGAVGLPWLIKAKALTGMAVATEVATRAHTLAAVEAGVDILWIGARTSANPFAVQEVADALRETGFSGPVLVKNPVNPDLELWIGALQRIYNAGIRRLGAIHRGFSAYGAHLYRNIPEWRIPFELHRRYPSLPIICDPSHIAGKRDLVPALARQAIEMGFDGLIIESHCCPDQALSDKAQQLTPDALVQLVAGLVARRGTDATESLSTLRDEIDGIDRELVEMLAKRMAVCREIGQYKKERHMPILQTDRYDSLISSRAAQGVEMGMSDEFMRAVLSAIHEESVRQQ
ncbi:MAG: bifunctional 3-deoxy-7-phosphoheptulonate synthase/chorismate mutase type II, partial [Muribaculaceae bacterium]|nr:bifunctional 3-deoxy-7-phosphoheptulonate synthase/chorismate mutase type II [Muribaculaceae bacterium]